MTKNPTQANGSALTPRQQRFVDEYLVDLNATQAAVRAGYSKRTAEQQGPRLLGNVGVAAAIAARMKVRSERLDIQADNVLQAIAKIAFADEQGSAADDIKVSDRLAALKLLGEHLGLFVQRRITYTKSIDQMSEDELVVLLGGETDPERLREIAAGKSTKLH